MRFIHIAGRTFGGKSRTQEAHTAKREAVSFGTHWQRWSGPAEEKRQNFYWWPGICSTGSRSLGELKEVGGMFASLEKTKGGADRREP